MNLNDKQKKAVNLAFGILISLVLIALGIMFAVSCYGIYKSAEKQMFTYESIGEAFDKIAVFTYIAIVLVIIGAVLSLLLPLNEKKPGAAMRVTSVYKKLRGRVEFSLINEENQHKAVKERKLRKVLLYVNIGIVFLEVILPLIYLLNPNTFPAQSGEYNTEVLHGILLYACMLLPLVIFEIAYFLVTRSSYLREIAIFKEALKAGAKSNTAEEVSEFFPKTSKFFSENEKSITLGVRIAMLGCAVWFIVLGITNGGMTDVLVKAVNICAECIGLG